MKILCKMGEIILKGLNRHTFEKQLVKNIQAAIGDEYQVARTQGVIIIDAPDDNAREIALKASKVFGIANVAMAHPCEKDIEAIKKKAEELSKNLKGSFKVEAKRSDKKFPLNSPQISQEVGGHLDDNCPNLTVDVNAPDFTIMIEVRESETYIHSEKIQGAGGLPVGTGGKAMLLLSGGIDSPVAGFMMAKRGAGLEAVHFYSYPYTSLQAKHKVIDLAKIMAEYCGSFKLHIVPFTDIQLAINKNCPLDYSTILMRVFMMQIANQVAARNKCEALITGECLAQVASQTLQALTVTDSTSSLPVLRPLIGMDKEEITKIARNIGTFETSILPYEDCCTVFTPKHPVTKPRMDKVQHSMGKLDVDGLIAEAIGEIETVRI